MANFTLLGVSNGKEQIMPSGDTPQDAGGNLIATRADLASTANGLGASLIGVEDSGANFTATNLEAVLVELAGASTSLYAADGTLAGARVVTMGGNSLTFNGTGNIVLADSGDISTDGDVAVNGGDLTTTSTTATLFNTNATTLNVGGAATTVSIGAGTGTTTINNASTVITGDLTVNGTTTTVNSTTVTVDDKNIELGSVASPTDITADGGGLTLKGATDKTFNWVNATDAWTSSEHIALLAGKDIIMNGLTSGAVTLDAPDVVTSYTLTLPAADGTANQVMETDGAGNLTFVTPATGRKGREFRIPFYFDGVNQITAAKIGDLTMLEAGFITGASVKMSAARTAGSIAIEPHKNGTGLTPATIDLLIDGTDTQEDSATVAFSTTDFDFAANDQIGFLITSTAFAPLGAQGELIIQTEIT